MMKKIIQSQHWAFLFCILFSYSAMGAVYPVKNQPALSLPVKLSSTDYGKIPLSFEARGNPNGQNIQFSSRGKGHKISLERDAMVLGVNEPGVAPIRMQFEGINPTSKLVGEHLQPHKTNYFIGNDPKKWRTGIANYAKVRYQNVYDGIDLVFYGNQQQLEYDFIVAPGVDPDQIKLTFQGAKSINISASGELELNTTSGKLIQQKPVIYQHIDGTRKTIAGNYQMLDDKQVGFKLAPYDTRQPLVIDPVLVYSTFVGGADAGSPFGGDSASSIAVDSAGNAYVAGITISTDFPTVNPIQGSKTPGVDGQDSEVFIFKLNAAGNALVFATYLGGEGDESPAGIELDSVGNIYLAGSTNSRTFPMMNPLQANVGVGPPNPGTYRGYVAKINPAGNALLYSTYFGDAGSEQGISDMTIDAAGNVYITGIASRPIPLVNADQPISGGSLREAYVAKINSTGTAHLYSTFLGGSADDWGYGIAVDNVGNAYVTGQTLSNDFPTLNPIYASGNGFLAKYNSSGAKVYSTYLPTSKREVAADSLGNAFVVGSGEIQKINAAGNAVSFTLPLDAFGSEIRLDSSDNIYLTGFTSSAAFPTVNAIQSTYGGAQDAVVVKLDSAGTTVFSSYLGGNGFDYGSGMAFDNDGNIYVVGGTQSPNFPTLNPLQAALSATRDAFVTKINLSPAVVKAATTTKLISSLNPSKVGQSVTFTATISGGTPPTGTVTFKEGSSVLGTSAVIGGKATLIISTLSKGKHLITATYAGDSSHLASTSSVIKQKVKSKNYHGHHGHQGHQGHHGHHGQHGDDDDDED